MADTAPHPPLASASDVRLSTQPILLGIRFLLRDIFFPSSPTDPIMNVLQPVQLRYRTSACFLLCFCLRLLDSPINFPPFSLYKILVVVILCASPHCTSLRLSFLLISTHTDLILAHSSQTPRSSRPEFHRLGLSLHNGERGQSFRPCDRHYHMVCFFCVFATHSLVPRKVDHYKR